MAVAFNLLATYSRPMLLASRYPSAIPVGQSRCNPCRAIPEFPSGAIPEFPMGAIPSAHITIPVGHSRSSPWAQSRQPKCNPGRALLEFPMGAISTAQAQEEARCHNLIHVWKLS